MLLYVVKIIAITELALIILFVFVSYVLKLVSNLKEKHNTKISTIINKQLNSIFNNETLLSDSIIKFFDKHALLLLMNISSLERKKDQFSNWNNTISQLSDRILKPKARKLTVKRNWFKKYIAVSYFSYGFAPEDEKLLKKLVSDDNFLIYINAARTITKYPSLELVSAFVHASAKGRRLQQSADAGIVSRESQDFSPMIFEILQSEQNLYVKAFCYRLLTYLSFPQTNINPIVEIDVRSENLELKISTLNYLATLKNDRVNPIVIDCIYDPRWQVRAVVVKILGNRRDEDALLLLKESLKDPEWWVRINAAHALQALGKNGIAVLESQSPQIDENAYEAAQEVLKILYSEKGNESV